MRLSLGVGKHASSTNSQVKKSYDYGMPGFDAIVDGVDEDNTEDHDSDGIFNEDTAGKAFQERGKAARRASRGDNSPKKKPKVTELDNEYRRSSLPGEAIEVGNSDGAMRGGSRRRFVNLEFKLPARKAPELLDVSRDNRNYVDVADADRDDADEFSNEEELKERTKPPQQRKPFGEMWKRVNSRTRKSQDDEWDGHGTQTNSLPVRTPADSTFAVREEPCKRFMSSRFKAPMRKAPESSCVSQNTVDQGDSRLRPYKAPYQPPKCQTPGETGLKSSRSVDAVSVERYAVMFCPWKPYTKRKGPWSDGFLVHSGRSIVLQDADGKLVSKDGEPRSGPLSDGDTLQIGKFEVEVMNKCTSDELEGRSPTGEVNTPLSEIVNCAQRPVYKRFQVPSFANESRSAVAAESLVQCVVPREEVAKSQNDLRGSMHISSVRADDLILHPDGGGGPVIVDPHLSSKCRPHQREGVKFLYECVMGLRDPAFKGCLLADAMGLGKTLQVITLIWTLLKQGACQNPTVKRVLIICPSSLVENWGKEMLKWLGNERLSPLIVHSGTSHKDVKRKISNFHVGTVYKVLVTSYEVLRRHKDDFTSAKPDLLVCDEAHRLKNCAGNKTIDALMELNCPKRVLLTGTPIQNDLLEFYAMIDFINPMLLGPLTAFKRDFANPIERSRDRNASGLERNLGSRRSEELQSKTKFCILQRSADVISKYLSKKTEFVVFCKLHPLQVRIYEDFLKSKLVCESLDSGQSAMALSAISTLRKLCNHPKLTDYDLKKMGDQLTTGHMPSSRFSARSAGWEDWRVSGKLHCLHTILSAVHDESQPDSKDKIVVVSNFTTTLDIVQTLCQGRGWRSLRLDGTTNVSERQALVDRFNIKHDETVFLLSAKAGGSGLNLIGANRLVLFDPDWNPATDAQAMARIWRDGQIKDVFIYRLLTTGSIEEKIYQRQIMKGEVAAAVEGRKSQSSSRHAVGQRHFSREDLRELFSLNAETKCDTHDLLSQAQLSGAECRKDCSNEVEDHALKEAVQSQVVTFVYQTINQEVVPPVEGADCEGEAVATQEEGIHSEDEGIISNGEETGCDVNVTDESDVEYPAGSADAMNITTAQQISYSATTATQYQYHKTVSSLEKDCLSMTESQVSRSVRGNIMDEYPSVFDVNEMDEILLEYGEQVPMTPTEQNNVDRFDRGRGTTEGFESPVHTDREENWNSKDCYFTTHRNLGDESRYDAALEPETRTLTCDGMKSLTSPATDSCDQRTNCDVLEHPQNVSLPSKSERDSRSGTDECQHLRECEGEQSLDSVASPVVCPGEGRFSEKEQVLHVDDERERSLPNDHLQYIPIPRRSTAVQANQLSARDTIPTAVSRNDTSNNESNAKGDIPKKSSSGDEVGALINSEDTQQKPADQILHEFDFQDILMRTLAEMIASDAELDVSEFDILDAPFLCSSDLEKEMTRVKFEAEDLWHGFKVFTLGSRCGVAEQWLAYERSKLGCLLDKCCIDTTLHGESLFCKGFPLIRAAVKRLCGDQASSISFPLDMYSQKEARASFVGK